MIPPEHFDTIHFAMTMSRLRFAKSETRDFADRDRLLMSELRLGDPSEWGMRTSTFFTAFVAIAAGLAALALILR